MYCYSHTRVSVTNSIIRHIFILKVLYLGFACDTNMSKTCHLSCFKDKVQTVRSAVVQHISVQSPVSVWMAGVLARSSWSVYPDICPTLHVNQDHWPTSNRDNINWNPACLVLSSVPCLCRHVSSHLKRGRHKYYVRVTLFHW